MVKDELLCTGALILKDIFRKEKGPLTSSEILSRMRDSYNLSIAGPQLREIIHYSRLKGIVPCLVAGGTGYLVTDNQAVMSEYLDSLKKESTGDSGGAFSIKEAGNILFDKAINYWRFCKH